ncbi:cation:proton antiporter [Aquabacterium sp. A7-Y]|uniref:cation:proton antiporter n=1 Tax=Aquabacterium sp. A7-Y TaxID=1349605 RepID=UPI00223D3D47|nr:cation:proton antiporter [Aquabacterium sp. A7-Y]MCW7539427.1 cation:proton antiporter [Aquabacterium sp. A7-Y]
MLVPWFVLVGAVLIVMAFSSHLVQRLPLSPAIVYLGVGALIGPLGAELLPIKPLRHAETLELLAEIAVLITLFAVGLRLRVPFSPRLWAVPIRLATLGMAVTTGLGMLAAHWVLGLPWPAALLLAAVLAPTDPVLASEVQIRQPGDRDAVRFSLTAEGGLNDGTAFPAVMLALGWMGVHELGAFGWRWIAVDLLWAVGAGLALGWWCGKAMAWAVARLRESGHRLEHEEFLVFGVIALVYGMALGIRAYGFLAVFAAGAALGHCELCGAFRAQGGEAVGDDASEPRDAAHSSRLIQFSVQCEHLAEVALVLLIGSALAWADWSARAVLFAAVLTGVVRPLAVLATVPRRLIERGPRRLVAWFGIRGVGSLYYLCYAYGEDVARSHAEPVASAALITIAVSILAHGISSTPLMERYMARHER